MEDNNSIRALRDIHKDEELTIDYSTFINHDFIIFAECGCGSNHCRKQVTGKDWLIHKLPLKYNYKVSQRIIIKWLHYLNTNALPEQHAAVECYLHD